MRNGIVYRKFYSKIGDKVVLTVYVPSCIVRDVLLHMHLQELHPSGRQTYRSFSESFYHPQAQKLARQLCRSCPHCAAERGSSDKFSRVPKIKVLKPPKPREGLSLDLVLLPETRDGYCYGLLIVDLFTLYVSFYPLKDKGSVSVAECLQKYFALHGKPKSVFSEDCLSFWRYVDRLLYNYKITHVTCNAYKKRGMSDMESQVLTLRKAYRTTIMQSRFFQQPEWSEIFPIVICKLNAAIVKLGINRESVHYGQLVESSLPVLTDVDIFGPLEEEFDQVCKRFRDKMGRFMGKKKRIKLKEDRLESGKKFCQHEYVMREVFLLNEFGKSFQTYTGPYRVMKVCAQGVELRDIRSGDVFSVAFKHVRKLKWNELFTLLPQHSENAWLESLGLTVESSAERKNKSQAEVESALGEESSQYVPHKKPGTLQPGKLYTVAIGNTPAKLRSCVKKATWRKDKATMRNTSCSGLPSIVRVFDEFDYYNDPLVDGLVHQEWDEEKEIYKMYDEKGRKLYSFCEEEVHRGKGRESYRGRKFISSFQSEMPGTLRLQLKREVDRGKRGMPVRFSDVTIYFY